MVDKVLDKDATWDSLTKKVQNFLGSDATLKLFYFSGHGSVDDAGAYIVTTDCSPERPGLSLGWLRKEIESASGTVILILDCCHAGAAVLKSTSPLKSLTRGDIDRTIENLPTGKLLIAACRAEETAAETPSIEHGVFTFFLLRGLNGEAANGQSKVTPTGLYDYVAGCLQGAGIQTPVLKGELSGLVVLGENFSVCSNCGKPVSSGMTLCASCSGTTTAA
jgi:uncharacterized caspase-like protein